MCVCVCVCVCVWREREGGSEKEIKKRGNRQIERETDRQPTYRETEKMDKTKLRLMTT